MNSPSPDSIGLPASIGLHKFCGRVYRALALCGSVDEANFFMRTNPATSLLCEARGGRLVIVNRQDSGEEAEYGRSNPKARHVYSVGVEGVVDPFDIKIHAYNRNSAMLLAKRLGYEVRDMNMVG